MPKVRVGPILRMRRHSERTELIAGYRHHVPHMTGESLTGRVAILHRRKHCSQEQDRPTVPSALAANGLEIDMVWLL